MAGRAVRFRPAYIALGLTRDAGLTWRLARHIGTARALDLLMTDGALDATAALAAGLVTRVVEDVDGEVDRLVAALASGPAEAYRRLKRLVHRAAGTDLAQHMDDEARAIAESAASPDGRGGIEAFVNRRSPRFGAAAAGPDVAV